MHGLEAAGLRNLFHSWLGQNGTSNIFALALSERGHEVMRPLASRREPHLPPSREGG